METFTLNDGVVIPSVGFGVFMIPVGDETYNAVRTALSLGYRHIDTAAAYFNEADVGRAIRDSGILREEIFVTSKLWLQNYGYEPAKKGIETSLKNLGLGYIDLSSSISHTATYRAHGKLWKKPRKKARSAPSAFPT